MAKEFQQLTQMLHWLDPFVLYNLREIYKDGGMALYTFLSHSRVIM